MKRLEITTQENFTTGYVIVNGELHLAQSIDGNMHTSAAKLCYYGVTACGAARKLGKKRVVTHYINNFNHKGILSFLKDNNISFSIKN